MVKLGAKEEAGQGGGRRRDRGAGRSGPARARVLADRPGPTLQVDDGFDRAWRRVGLALDRSGFTVEDRDRAQGLYFVRYVDPAFAGREEPGFFAKLFSFGKKDDGSGARTTASRSRPKARPPAPSPSSMRRASPKTATPASASSACSSTT